MANVYNIAKGRLGSVWKWNDTGETFKLMLVTNTYVHDPDHQFRSDVNGECTNPNYPAGGIAIAGRAVIVSDVNDESVYDAADVTFPLVEAGDQPVAGIVYRDTGLASTDDLVSFHAIGTPPTPDGGDIVGQWGSKGVFSLGD